MNPAPESAKSNLVFMIYVLTRVCVLRVILIWPSMIYPYIKIHYILSVIVILCIL